MNIISDLTQADTNVSMPLYHSMDEYGIGGTIMAKYAYDIDFCQRN